MIKITREQVDKTEHNYPGFKKSLDCYEETPCPSCPHCESSDTAFCSAGIVGRSMALASATTRIKLHANGPFKGEFFCNACKQYFDNPDYHRPGMKVDPPKESSPGEAINRALESSLMKQVEQHLMDLQKPSPSTDTPPAS